MGKPLKGVETVPIILSYSRQRQETKEETLNLLKKIADEHDLPELANTKDYEEILNSVRKLM